MARVILNPVLEAVRGKIGDLVFKRHGNDVIVGHLPDFTGREWTPEQLAHRARFRLAALYGKTVLADPATRALYESKAKAKGQPIFSLTIADFFNAPVVEEVDLSAYTGKTGEAIRIRASDDFEVIGVEVDIRDTTGTVLEHGAATRAGADATWAYTATANLPAGQSVSIEVTASDRPGNKSTKTETKPV